MASLAVIVATATILGVTHGLEPDHLAGIAALSGNGGRASVLTGTWFAAGHVGLLLVWVGLWLALGGLVATDALTPLGPVVVGGLLAAVSLLVGITNLRRRLHRRVHEHDGLGRHTHYHVHLPWQWLPESDAPGHDHSTWRSLRTAAIGALFTLSPPLSMIAFLATLLPAASGVSTSLAIVVYVAAITTTMTVVGAGVGRGKRLARRFGPDGAAALEVVASAAVFVFAVALLAQHLPVGG